MISIIVLLFLSQIIACPSGYEEQSFLFKKWCSKCSEGYYSQEGWNKCQKCCEGCSECESPSGTCLSCKEGYEYINGKCNQYQSKTPCKQCNEREYSLEGSGKCNQVDISCKTFDKKNGNCLTCEDGYGIINGKCIKCLSGTYSNSQTNYNCEECKEGEFSYPGWKKCLPCQVSCTSCDKTTGKCWTCYKGHYLNTNNGKCDECPPGTYNEMNSLTMCKECPKGTYARKGWGKCVTCGSICIDCDKTNGKCLQCENGYEINENGRCYKKVNDEL